VNHALLTVACDSNAAWAVFHTVAPELSKQCREPLLHPLLLPQPTSHKSSGNMSPSPTPDTEALLASSQRDASRASARRRTALPLGQLFAVYLIKLMVPVAAFQILPYVNEMVAHAVQRPPSEIGYYSGLVATAYNVANGLTVYPWGRLSGMCSALGVSCMARRLSRAD
jgi:hypothetical protein